MIISQVTLALYFSIIMILCGVFFSAYIYNFSAQESLTQLLNTMDINVVMSWEVTPMPAKTARNEIIAIASTPVKMS
jgi:hypothetical protein